MDILSPFLNNDLFSKLQFRMRVSVYNNVITRDWKLLKIKMEKCARKYKRKKF